MLLNILSTEYQQLNNTYKPIFNSQILVLKGC